MVLDNWGTVDRWIAEAKVTSHGPSGIGFVNFGAINQLDVQAPIETFGQGARGFNVYAGTVGSAEFDRIVTHANGAVGLQISQPIGMILVKRGVETFGSAGDSLGEGRGYTALADCLQHQAGRRGRTRRDTRWPGYPRPRNRGPGAPWSGA
jgi:hypothetical protein